MIQMIQEIQFIGQLEEAEDYDRHRSLMQENLGIIGEGLVQAFAQLRTAPSCPPEFACHLEIDCALIFAEAVPIHVERGNYTMADSCAETALSSLQRAFYLPGSLNLTGYREMVKTHVDLALTCAGDFRRNGMEARGWQAYQIVDPIQAAIELSESKYGGVSTIRYLEAAAILRQVGMADESAELTEKARRATPTAEQHAREKDLATRLVTVPSCLPDPDVYSGTSMSEAIRFKSQIVGARCLAQTPCPECRGPLKHVTQGLTGSEEKAYNVHTFECERYPAHSPITLYKDATFEDSMVHLGPLLTAYAASQEESTAETGSFTPPTVTRPSQRLKRTYTFTYVTITVILVALLYMTASLLSWGVCGLLGLATSYWRTFLGSLAGVACFLLTAVLTATLVTLARRGRTPRPGAVRTAAAVLGVLLAFPAGYSIGGWPSVMALTILLLAYLARKAFGRRSQPARGK